MAPRRPGSLDYHATHPLAMDIEREAFADVFHDDVLIQSTARAWQAPAETLLWIAVVQDALDTASRLGRGKALPGDSTHPGRWRLQQDRHRRELLDWLCLCRECLPFEGSLPWIAAKVEATTGAVIDVEHVRRKILQALDHGAGARERRRDAKGPKKAYFVPRKRSSHE